MYNIIVLCAAKKVPAAWDMQPGPKVVSTGVDSGYFQLRILWKSYSSGLGMYFLAAS